MASPHETYRGKAPTAMARMGEGIAEAYGNVGRMYAQTGAIEGQGYASLGQSIGQLAQGLGGAYGDYKKMASSIKTSEKFFGDMRDSGYLDPKLSSAIDTTVSSPEYKNMGTYEKAQYWDQVKGVTGSAVAQHFNMQQIGANQGAATGRTVISENAANLRNTETLGAQASNANLNAWLQMFNSTPLINAQRGTSTLSQPRRLQLGSQVGGNIYDEPPR